MKAKHHMKHKRLAPLPISKSRKKARKITTLFHRYTQLKEQATTMDEKNRIDLLIDEIGGQTAYQKASQLSTSYHSTSKWVLGYLAQNGWLYGIDDSTIKGSERVAGSATFATTKNECKEIFIPGPNRRVTSLLEIGAINTELLDAAEATILHTDKKQDSLSPKKYRLHVRSIDLHSMHERIEETDFLSLSWTQFESNYDVIVCSMVLNCVPTAVQRGAMLLRIVHFLRPGGLVFFTIPKTCLNLSPFMDANRFTQLLQHVGLNVLEHKKESPKIFFFLGQKAAKSIGKPFKEWQQKTIIKHGRKLRNNFDVLLPAEKV
jgi:25S rRNA (adenine2142-N1)-methyltransferase